MQKFAKLESLKKISWILVKQFLFWMLFFALTRAVFLIYETPQIKGFDLISIIAVFWHALRLDISSACFILVIPFLLLFVQSMWNPKWLNWFHFVYTLIFLMLFSAIIVAEMGVYEEWKTKLHYKALLYLIHPSEIANTAKTGTLILLSGIWLLITGISFFVWYKLFRVSILKLKRNLWFSFPFLLIVSFMFVLGFRGGLQQIPINQSESYFSKHNILNLAAVNSGWNLLHSVVQNYIAIGKNPFVFYSTEEVNRETNRMITVANDSTTLILNSKRPNIVLIILEGWSADVSEPFGGDAGITPFFNGIARQGVVFSDIYGVGSRSQQGMSAIFSGFPAIPYSTITQQPEKYNKLPSMIKKIDSLGYATSFLFGGQLDYGNLKSYIMYNEFDRITEESDIDTDLPRGKLGVHDEYIFPILLNSLDQEQQPFFASLFTLSTHSPYDQEMNDLFPEYIIEHNYVNAAYYSDQCLKVFFEKARSKPWYSNTLFVFISDHGHTSYKDWYLYSPEYYKIVFMLYGDVIKPEYRGLKVEKIGSQLDLPATIFSQIGLKSNEFHWSKNLMNPYSPDYAFFAFEVGLGWVRPDGFYIHEFRLNQSFYSDADSNCIYSRPELEKQGRSYLQRAYQEYLDM